MNSRLSPVLCAAAFLVLILSGSADANDNSQPLSGLGGNVQYFGPNTYAWQSATDDGTYRYDTYATAGNVYALEIKSMLDGAALGTVTGTSAQGQVSGYIHNGSSVQDYIVINTDTGSYKQFTTTTLDLEAGTLKTRTTEIIDEVDIYIEMWSDTSGAFGEIFRGVSPGGSFTLFGQAYWAGSGSWESITSTDGNGVSHYYCKVIDHLVSNDSSWIEVQRVYDDPSQATSVVTITGWHPILGSLSSSDDPGHTYSNISNVVWDERTAPLVFPGGLWIKYDGPAYRLFSWASTDINNDGSVVDRYVQGGNTVSVTGNPVASSGMLSIKWNNGSQIAYVQNGTIGGTSPYSSYHVRSTPPGAVQSTPFFTGASTLWVNGETGYPFAYGYEDAEGTHTDVYLAGSGMLILYAATTAPQASATLVHGGNHSYGTMTKGNSESFNMPGASTISAAAPGTPEALWVGNVFYRRTSGTNNYASFPGSTDTLSLTGTNPASYGVVGIHGGVGHPLTGTFSPAAGGLAILTRGSEPVLACVADAAGAGVLGGSADRADFPPAIQTGNVILEFLGKAAEDGAAGETAAYYGDTRTDIFRTDPEDQNYEIPLSTAPRTLLKIRYGTDPLLAVSVTDYTNGTTKTGKYDPASHLFHAASGSSSAMPKAISVNPLTGDTIWLIARPAGLPASFIIRGEPWWFAGVSGAGVATYRGFYNGQEMILGAPNAVTEARTVLLRDLKHNGNDSASYGSLSGVRGSARLADGTLVVSGDDSGTAKAVVPGTTPNVHSIASDLDIVGDNLSFGVLQGDASLAGALFHFGDVGGVATLTQSLSRANAVWKWSRMDEEDPEALRGVMRLDASHKLQLYSPTLSSSSNPGIVLDPAGISSFKEPVRVAPGGDISMGVYTEGAQP